MNYHKMSDYELLSRLAEDLSFLKASNDWRWYEDMEEQIAVLGQRPWPSARAKMIRILEARDASRTD